MNTCMLVNTCHVYTSGINYCSECVLLNVGPQTKLMLVGVERKYDNNIIYTTGVNARVRYSSPFHPNHLIQV